MKVQDVMTSEVGFISTSDDLTRAVDVMWRKDCGVVPIVDVENRVVGMVSDRDVCIAVGSRDLKASEIKAEEFCSDTVITCEPEEKIKDALKKMRKHQMKRLPVTSQSGELVGIISISDILQTTENDKKTREKLVSALLEISKPRPITLREIE